MKGRSCVVVHRNMLFIIKWKILRILFQNGLPISSRVKKKGLEPKKDEVQSGITSFRLRMLVVSGYFKPNVTPS